MSEKILEVKDLAVSIDTYAGSVKAVRGVSFSIEKGETCAIVGESGCGKSMTVQTIMRLNPTPPYHIDHGQILYKGKDIVGYTEKQMEKLRGKEMSMIFQDPMTSLNPTMRVGNQIKEGIMKHTSVSRKESIARVMEMIRLVGIPNPEENMIRYPHTYSGGMRQRIMIAMALATNPSILIADEPTTALDVTMQAQILDLMNDLKDKLGTAIIIITHNLGVVARMAKHVAVMYAGKIVETGTVLEVFNHPKHPYTLGLLGSMPDLKKTGDGKKLITIPGSPPDLLNPPVGCAFAARCKHCMDVCKQYEPPVSEINNEHKVACWLLDARAPKVTE